MGEYYKAKKDLGKVKFHYLPTRPLKWVARVLEFGSLKGYGFSSWEKVPDALERYTDAMRRHLYNDVDYVQSEKKGESPNINYDEESGIITAAHTACDALFVLQIMLEKTGKTDRELEKIMFDAFELYKKLSKED